MLSVGPAGVGEREGAASHIRDASSFSSLSDRTGFRQQPSLYHTTVHLVYAAQGDHDHGSTHRDEEPTRLGAVGAAGKPQGRRRDSRQEGVME